jgi:hypothetical protein
MIIYHDPDEWVSEVKEIGISIDSFGIECGNVCYSLRRATPEEYRKNRSARLKKEREDLLKRLHQIEFEMGNKPQF